MSDGFSDGVTIPEATAPTTEGTEQQEKNYVSELVGEGKKFKSLEEGFAALAKKAEHADSFIETLKTEKQQIEQQYREQTTKTRTIDEIVELIKPKPQEVQQPAATKQEVKSGLTIDDVKSYLEEERRRATVKEAAENLWKRLSSEEVFGSREVASKVVAEYIGNDPIRKTLVDQMAVVDPTGLEKLLKEVAKPKESVQFMDSMQGERTPEIPTQPQGKLTWDVVRKVRKENPKLYNSKAFQARMHKEL